MQVTEQESGADKALTTTARNRNRNRNLKRMLPPSVRARMTPGKAFKAMTTRVVWLNDKIQRRSEEGAPVDLYVEERDAIFWMMDKIRDLSKRLKH